MQALRPLLSAQRARCVLRWLSTLPEHRKIIMPKVSPTMTAGRLVAWKKAEGDAFEEGDDLGDVESDKATMQITASEDGFVARILVPDDTADIPLGRILMITVEEEEHIAAFKDYSPPDGESATQSPAPAASAGAESTPAPSTSTPTTSLSEYNGPIGPAIMRLLNEYPTLNLHAITPTGPQGRMLKGDVLAAIEAGTAFSTAPSTPITQGQPQVQTEQADATPVQPSAEGLPSYTDIPVSSMRRAIAKRLSASKISVPHRYASSTYQLDKLLALRKRLNAVEPSPKISVNDFVIRAVGIALRRIPEMNVYWNDQLKEVVPNINIDVSVAVAIEGGLITPIVTNVDSRGLAEIAQTTKDLVVRARAGALDPEEYEGGSFSVSNLGMFGISKFSAIINPPQSGILAVGSGVAQAKMDEDGTLQTVTEGIATLSTDARAIEETTAAEFLEEFTKCMSNPENMLM